MESNVEQNTFEGTIRELQHYYHHDSDRYQEVMLDIIDNELDVVLKSLKELRTPIHLNKVLFDKAIKLVYILQYKGWLDLFVEEKPMHEELVSYFLKIAIRSIKGINFIAPEYNNL